MIGKIRFCALSAAAFALSASAATPSITGTPAIKQDPGRRVTVSYTLSGDEPAIVTCVFQTNFTDSAGTERWASIGGKNHGNLMGDVNTTVSPGERKIRWYPDKYWPNQTVPANGFRALVKAYPTNSPPDYLVIDLEDGSKTWFEGEDYLPDGGLTNNVYRTDRMVMRRIPAAGVTWTMGDDPDDGFKPCDTASRHPVMLTSDYYMAIFEMTYGQLVKVTGGNYANKQSFSNETFKFIRPATGVRFGELRGNETGYLWPFNPEGGFKHDITDVFNRKNTILCDFRSVTGLRLDLPTEAQWEYACRAGVSAQLYNGETVTGKVCENLDGLGRYKGNGGDMTGIDILTCSTNHGTAVVGSYMPNDWGLYDMLGNVREWCLDRSGESNVEDYQFKTGTTIDPLGGTWNEGNTPRILRGGSYLQDSYVCTSAYREYVIEASGNPGSYVGCRLCWTLNPTED